VNLDPSTTALVLIEYQNEFTSEGGVLHKAVSDVMTATNMLSNTVNLVDAARKKGVTIMHAPITFAAGYGELTRHPYGILKGVVDGKAFIRGSWGAAIVDALAPAPGDIVIEGKRGLDTFASTNLCCVESTMRTAYEHGFEVITLTDCVAGTSVEEHANAIKFDYPMFSKPMPSSELLGHLGN
jgi:nicotinamidase-related amidase